MPRTMADPALVPSERAMDLVNASVAVSLRRDLEVDRLTLVPE